MVTDAIKDCSKRGDLILDPFGGSGTTLIAAEKAKRRAAVIELDPRYADLTIRRWQSYAGGMATNAISGAPFSDGVTTSDAPQPSHFHRGDRRGG
jgi:DNA modification methylase